MNTIEAQFPPLAQALGRLRQGRARPGLPRLAEPDVAAPAATPEHDLLRLMPEPALAPEFFPAQARPAAIPGPELARPYWFDL